MALPAVSTTAGTSAVSVVSATWLSTLRNYDLGHRASSHVTAPPGTNRRNAESFPEVHGIPDGVPIGYSLACRTKPTPTVAYSPQAPRLRRGSRGIWDGNALASSFQ